MTGRGARLVQEGLPHDATTPERPRAADRACACGCGHPSSRKSRYFDNHREVLSAARRRLRRTKKWASQAGVEFSISYDDIRVGVLSAWPDMDWRIARLDTSSGFVPGNVHLLRTKPAAKQRQRAFSPEEAAKLIHARLTATEASEVPLESLAAAWRRQAGRCHWTGRELILAGRRREPDAVRVHLSASETGLRVRLATYAAIVAMHAWGPKHLVRLAHDVVVHAADKKKQKLTRKRKERL